MSKRICSVTIEEEREGEQVSAFNYFSRFSVAGLYSIE
jgi:hypothetical protein